MQHFANPECVLKHVRSKVCEARACIGCNEVFSDADIAARHSEGCQPYLVKALKEDMAKHISELCAQLCSACIRGDQRGSDCQLCKKSLRKAQLEWHPDKNPFKRELATHVFLHVQALWEGSGVDDPTSSGRPGRERAQQEEAERRMRRQAEQEEEILLRQEAERINKYKEEERRRQASEEKERNRPQSAEGSFCAVQ
mmetsp:Transcript_30283/g.77430  ORF Transcript_30283/g.77430 Transcript_30283/m.77430 type:complete len:198 (+) Transcript_30283:211-804(+)